MSKTNEKISLWIDRIGDPADPAIIIVSLDDDTASDTLCTFELAEMDEAREAARRIASERGLPAVVEDPDGSGQWRAL